MFIILLIVGYGLIVLNLYKAINRNNTRTQRIAGGVVAATLMVFFVAYVFVKYMGIGIDPVPFVQWDY